MNVSNHDDDDVLNHFHSFFNFLWYETIRFVIFLSFRLSIIVDVKINVAVLLETQFNIW